MGGVIDGTTTAALADLQALPIRIQIGKARENAADKEVATPAPGRVLMCVLLVEDGQANENCPPRLLEARDGVSWPVIRLKDKSRRKKCQAKTAPFVAMPQSKHVRVLLSPYYHLRYIGERRIRIRRAWHTKRPDETDFGTGFQGRENGDVTSADRFQAST
jgi:hypothetical protein